MKAFPRINSDEPRRAANAAALSARAGLAAVVAVVVLTALGTSASAFTENFFGGGWSSATPPREDSRPVPNVQRPPREPAKAARPKNARVAKADPKDDALAAKAKGPLQIVISIEKQQLTLYAGGQQVARTRVSTGTRDYPTPTGVFSVIQKDRWHRSNLYDDAPMYYMQRLTWSGVAMHEGVVPNRPASHGCVRLPSAFARQLWAATKIGARVVVTRGDVVPVAFSHPRLFAPKREPDMSSAALQEAADYALKGLQTVGLAPPSGETTTDATPPADTAPDSAKPPAPVLKPGPISIFISRKEGKLFVRKGFEPVFDTPVTFDRPQEPLGTHVFSATATNDDKTELRWSVMSVPSSAKAAHSGQTAAAALDRITIPPEAVDRISALITPGASLIVSDQGLGPETGKGTDFIVLTR